MKLLKIVFWDSACLLSRRVTHLLRGIVFPSESARKYTGNVLRSSGKPATWAGLCASLAGQTILGANSAQGADRKAALWKNKCGQTPMPLGYAIVARE